MLNPKEKPLPPWDASVLIYLFVSPFHLPRSFRSYRAALYDGAVRPRCDIHCRRVYGGQCRRTMYGRPGRRPHLHRCGPYDKRRCEPRCCHLRAIAFVLFGVHSTYYSPLSCGRSSKALYGWRNTSWRMGVFRPLFRRTRP